MTVDISVIDTSYMHSVIATAGIESRSLAPWQYRLDLDPERYPFVIAEANCISSVCTTEEENRDLFSIPIEQEILVLRREQKHCGYRYKLEMQRVTLGCTCARPNAL
ncbi:hypothetical protein GDO86_010570 [Hymenochirus boettgeri]|uniref:Uncharacterized protein n=1 Tax=Hymenochirus boettgeri TaxID=247094 RepID=A0A8T2JTK4_9PIPI|nr:hypothetical protein GDO86_010570 [Hymenochirus boettgeri]